jgi:hypothetical protein
MELIDALPKSSRSVVEQLLATKQLTPDGLRWVLNAINPFPDFDVKCVGFPDARPARSICQTITKTFTVTKPSAITGNWQCLVFNAPFTPNSNIVGNGLTPVLMFADNSPQSQATRPSLYSGINVFATAPTDNWSTQTTANGNVSFDDVAMPVNFSTGDHRLVGVGYEVVNTTAEIYRQGSVTSARVPSSTVASFLCEPAAAEKYAEIMKYVERKKDPVEKKSTMKAVTKEFAKGLKNSPGDLVVPADWLSLPPANVDTAALYPGSVTWAAKDGVYGIPTLNSKVVPITRNILHHVAMCAPYTTPSFTGWCALPGDNAVTHCYPWDVTCSFFTGLSPETSLTVTARYYVERFPSLDDPDLIVLAQPSNPYDSVAMELYARCMSSLPVAVKQGENPLGEWFRTALSVAAKVAPIVGTLAGAVFGAPQVGSVAGALAARTLAAGADAIPDEAKKKRRRKRRKAAPAQQQQQQNAPAQSVGGKQGRQRPARGRTRTAPHK